MWELRICRQQRIYEMHKPDPGDGLPRVVCTELEAARSLRSKSRIPTIKYNFLELIAKEGVYFKFPSHDQIDYNLGPWPPVA